jgi:hypothetical protein
MGPVEEQRTSVKQPFAAPLGRPSPNDNFLSGRTQEQIRKRSSVNPQNFSGVGRANFVDGFPGNYAPGPCSIGNQIGEK